MNFIIQRRLTIKAIAAIEETKYKFDQIGSRNLYPWTAGRPDPSLNFFGVLASKSLSYWREKGWIYEDDPRGWFQWYCRYFEGRRCPDDDRQIKRWLAMRRHIAQLVKNCRKGDFNCRPKQRQAILHWAYDSRKL